MPSVADLCSILAQELINMQAEAPKTVFVSHTLQQCGDFHTRIKRLLGENITVPPGPNVCNIPISFSSAKPFLHLHQGWSYGKRPYKNFERKRLTYIATTAFGLGWTVKI